MRICERCGSSKPEGDFYSRTNGGFRRACKTCLCAAERDRREARDGDVGAQLQRARYKRDRDALLANRRAQVEEKRRYITEMKQRPCTDCSRTFPEVAMDFDHVPERGQKLCDVSRMVYGSYSMQSVKDEIAKCDLVCACCHRIRSAGRRWSRSNKRIAKGRWPKCA